MLWIWRGPRRRRVGQSNIDFVTSDVHALDLPDDTFDIVHAHQVCCSTWPDPVQALREKMRRVCKPGGIVAARDADYAGFSWFPQLPPLDRWMTLYCAAARANGGEPDAGRRLLSWAQHAGFDDITPTGGLWCFATPETRDWWGGMWADRIVESAPVATAGRVEDGHRRELDEIASAWRDWAAAPDGWLAIPHGEILCRGYPSLVRITWSRGRYWHSLFLQVRYRLKDNALWLAVLIDQGGKRASRR